MSNFNKQDKPSNRGYGKPAPQYIRGDRYGHQAGYLRPPIIKRENIPTQENIPIEKSDNFYTGPPIWLDSYLNDFKKKFIAEISSAIVQELDASYKNDAEKQRYKASFWALKKRLRNLQAQMNTDDSHLSQSQQPFAYSNTTNNQSNKQFNKSPSSSSKDLNIANGPPSNKGNVHEQNIMCKLTSDNQVPKRTATDVTTLVATKMTALQFIQEFGQDINDTAKPGHVNQEMTKNIEEEKTDNTEFSAELDAKYESVIDDGAIIINTDPMINLSPFSNEKSETESCPSVEDLLQAFVDETEVNKSFCKKGPETESLPSVEDLLQAIVDETEVSKIFCKKVKSMLNKLTTENFEVISTKIKELEMDTPEKQQEVINVLVDRAIEEPMYSVVYAQMCRKLADEYNCLSTFQEMLIIRCDAELMHIKEKENLRMIKEKDIEICNDENKIKEDQTNVDEKKPYDFMGAILFIGELYNQEVFTGTIIEKCLQCLLQNYTEIHLEYLCHILRLIGKNFQLREKSIAPYMNHLVEFLQTDKVGEHLTALIQSLTELVANNWKPIVPDVSGETTEFEDADDNE